MQYSFYISLNYKIALYALLPSLLSDMILLQAPPLNYDVYAALLLIAALPQTLGAFNLCPFTNILYTRFCVVLSEFFIHILTPRDFRT